MAATLHLARGRTLRPSATTFRPGLMLECTMLSLWLVACWFLSAVMVDPAWSLVAFVNFIWMVTLALRIEWQGMVIFGPLLIALLSTMVALPLIEYGFPMFELGIVGEPGPWSNALNFYTMIMLASYIIAFRLLTAGGALKPASPMTMRLQRYAPIAAILLLCAVWLLLLYMAVRGLMSGFPLFTGQDRFAFRRFSADKITVYGLGFKFVPAVGLGLGAFELPIGRLLKIALIATFVAMILLDFLYGDKFSSQLIACAYFFSPYLYNMKIKNLNFLVIARIIFIAAVPLAATSAVTWGIYSNFGRSTTTASIEKLSGRLVGQGELWFLQARIGAPLLNWDSTVVNSTIAAMRVKEVGLFSVRESIGPNYFSNHYAPNNIRSSLQRNAGFVTYAGAGVPLYLEAFGWVGLFGAMIVCGIIFALVSVYFRFALLKKSIISGMFSAFISLQVANGLIGGEPWLFMGIYALKWFLVIFIWELARYTYEKIQIKA